MFGKNLKLPSEKGDGTILKITNIFATIQGEGPYAGYPSVFIRTSGCNLACTFCDTEFDSYKLIHLDDIIKKVAELSPDYKKLIVITGGEPLRQNITPLCNSLIALGHNVQLESNGTLYCENLPNKVEIVCSPKPSNDRYHTIRDDVLKQTIAIKFIVSASDKYKNHSNIAEVGQSKYRITVYVQPMDEYDEILNKNNLDLAIKLSIEKNCILSLQLHKVIGVE